MGCYYKSSNSTSLTILWNNPNSSGKSPGSNPILQIDDLVFLEVEIKFCYISRVVYIAATAYDTINNIKITFEKMGFDIHFLEQFGLNLTHYNSEDMSSIEDIVKILGKLDVWKNGVKNLQYKTPKSYFKALPDFKKSLKEHDAFCNTHDYGPRSATLDQIEKMKAQEKKILELQETISELKEEIELLRAMNQEC